VSVRGGLHLDRPRVSIPLTAGVEAGGARSVGVGLEGGGSLTLPWLAGVFGGGVEVGVGPRVRLSATLEGFVPVTRARVLVGRDGPPAVLHTAAAFGGRALLGISFTIVRPRDG
ncbi:MAG: hypothetical protein K0V04_06365, partial [Deltaproteobacteria bacterium]|nr:hypothetical protein [Deltaproteobacteria bacterium]